VDPARWPRRSTARAASLSRHAARARSARQARKELDAAGGSAGTHEYRSRPGPRARRASRPSPVTGPASRLCSARALACRPLPRMRGRHWFPQRATRIRRRRRARLAAASARRYAAARRRPSLHWRDAPRHHPPRANDAAPHREAATRMPLRGRMGRPVGEMPITRRVRESRRCRALSISAGC
jgi:hypothetical protein